MGGQDTPYIDFERLLSLPVMADGCNLNINVSLDNIGYVRYNKRVIGVM